MKFASMMTLIALAEACETVESERSADFLQWVAESLRRVVRSDPAEPMGQEACDRDGQRPDAVAPQPLLPASQEFVPG